MGIILLDLHNINNTSATDWIVGQPGGFPGTHHQKKYEIRDFEGQKDYPSIQDGYLKS